MKTLAIIGGGAAGLAAAVAAGEAGGVNVVLYEADERVGRSILATGNGRCNFSNSAPDPARYRNADFVAEVLRRFELAVGGDSDADAGDRSGKGADVDKVHGGRVFSRRGSFGPGENGVLDFFARHGLCWREEGEGRLYPLTNKAATVLDVLRAAVGAAGVEERVGSRVEAVEPPRHAGGCFTLRMADGSFERADAVVVACGGRSSSLGLDALLPFREFAPVLGPLAASPRITRQLDNIRVRGAVELRRDGKTVHRERGEALFRKYGVSGIVVFDVSRFARRGDELLVDFLPDVSLDEATALLNVRRKRLRALYGDALTCDDVLRGMVLPQVAHVLLAQVGLRESDRYEKSFASRLAPVLKGLPLSVEGVADPRQCQVSRGGFAVESFCPSTLEAKAIPGLHVAGEALDVDAPCGGYNLHWAWASGLIAGRCAARRLREGGGSKGDCR